MVSRNSISSKSNEIPAQVYFRVNIDTVNAFVTSKLYKPFAFQINRSCGGTFNTLSISSRGLQYSCALGEYVPRVARLFLAIMKNATKKIPPMMKIPMRTGITTIAISVIIGVIPVSFSAIFY